MPALKRKSPKLITLDTITERTLEWLWHPLIPRGAATMLFGPGGMGKSHITCDLAARISTGAPFPGEVSRRIPSKVLMMSAEDEYDTVLVPRLRRAGADLTKIAVPEQTFTLDLAGVRLVEDYMREFSATIAFIDPIVAWAGGKIDMNKANEVRELIGGLHQAAIRSQTAVIIVHHSRKGQTGSDWEKAMGSVDFNNAVRSVLYADRAPDGTRLMKHVKSNYAKLGPAWAYDFDENGLLWGDTFEDDQIELLNTPNAPAPTRLGPRIPKIDQARHFLCAFLSSGRARATEVAKIAEQEGIKGGTLQRAKIGLVNSIAEKKDGQFIWWWELEDNEATTRYCANLSGVGVPRLAAPPSNGRDGGHTIDPYEIGGIAPPVPPVAAGGPVADDIDEIVNAYFRTKGRA